MHPRHQTTRQKIATDPAIPNCCQIYNRAPLKKVGGYIQIFLVLFSFELDPPPKINDVLAAPVGRNVRRISHVRRISYVMQDAWIARYWDRRASVFCWKSTLLWDLNISLKLPRWKADVHRTRDMIASLGLSFVRGESSADLMYTDFVNPGM